ncbi:hypothetical protein [Methylobacterium sp. WL6]|uniref:hypothetical protein n=1 Tax=Methylobacterium sp. WL6 TaxID=2603901 RepID=UPI0011CB5B87|nr:hypothetical protein [Methylobacterium sp. WL6]TXN72404.1 hypothetical protein FV230_05100 [Methylobacterium sp. WL6]
MSGFVWSRTQPDSHYDFIARDADGYLVGRIRRETGLRAGKWSFFANGVQAAPGTVGCALSGTVETRDEAIEQLHVAWRAWMAIGGAAQRVR